MSFFFFVPIWLVFVATGLVFLLSPQFRFLSAYLCAVLDNGMAFVVCSVLTGNHCSRKVVGQNEFRLGGTFRLPSGDWISAIVATAIGFIGARKMNTLVGWQHSSN